jgi:Lon protease-like protein
VIEPGPAAMFPLGTVLFPSAYLPLHVFEPRYREMVRACLDGDACFGVTLIERGSEVGGGDVRTSVGTLARIVEAAELPDGRWALGTVGTERIRVRRWLEDDPFPRADIEPWPDEPDEPDDAGHGEEGARSPAEVVSRLRRCLALQTELGMPGAPATIELSDDPGLATFQAAAVAPLGPADHQALLAAPGASRRLALLDRLLAEREVDLRLQLDLDTPGGDPGAPPGD